MQKKTAKVVHIQQRKPLKIVIGINSLSSSPYLAYSNHMSAFHKLGRWAQAGGHTIAFNNPERMSIDRMRNQCAKIALDIKADYLLFWDDDVLVPLDFIEHLLACDADIAAADVLIRGLPFDHMAFLGDQKGGLHTISDTTPLVKKAKSAIVPVDAVGFSLCLIKVDLLRKMSDPWFITGTANTEDIYFCLKSRQLDKKTSIKLHTGIQCGHILWHEVISMENRANYTKYQEAQYPHLKAERLQGERDKLKKSSSTGDRGAQYLKEIKSLTKRSR